MKGETKTYNVAGDFVPTQREGSSTAAEIAANVVSDVKEEKKRAKEERRAKRRAEKDKQKQKSGETEWRVEGEKGQEEKTEGERQCAHAHG